MVFLWFPYGFPMVFHVPNHQPAGCFVNTLVTPKVHRPCTIIIQDEPVAKPLGNSLTVPLKHHETARHRCCH